MQKKRKKIVLITAGILFVCVAAFLFLVRDYYAIGPLLDYLNEPGRKAAYLSDEGYADVLGVADLDYEEILQQYGEPENQKLWSSADEPDRKLLDCQYSDFNVRYVLSEDRNHETSYRLTLLTITSKDLRFGRLKIGIGSPRLAVRIAYLFDKKIDADELAYSARDDPGVDEGFYGEDWCRILFCYDEHGRVTSMAYDPPAN